MNDLPRSSLCQVINSYGSSLCYDPRRTEALLNDLCGQYKGEIFALVTVQESGIPNELVKRANDMAGHILVAQLTRQFVKALPLDEDAARWAVESWALALEVITPETDSQSEEVRFVPPDSHDAEPHLANPSISGRILPGQAAPGTTWKRPRDGKVMVWVPAGEFVMGSDRGDDGEKPLHRVVLDGFWIDCMPVTNAQFARFLRQQGNQIEGSRIWLKQALSRIAVPGYEDHPVVAVSWDGAAAYARWVGGRLPTEAEWEYAARGPQGRFYPWGDTFDVRRLNCHESGIGDTTSVGKYPDGKSWSGALDMAGNVWEWVADWYGPYSADRQENPTGPASGSVRVSRGGSFNSRSDYVHCACRYWGVPLSLHIGFRVAATPARADAVCVKASGLATINGQGDSVACPIGADADGYGTMDSLSLTTAKKRMLARIVVSVFGLCLAAISFQPPPSLAILPDGVSYLLAIAGLSLFLTAVIPGPESRSGQAVKLMLAVVASSALVILGSLLL